MRIGVPARDFWGLSLREWRALTAPPGVDALSRAGLNAMLERFPDK